MEGALIQKPKEVITEHLQSQLPEWKRERLENQQYRLVGRHSAVKICYWCKKSIRGQADCYKNDFYGIPSHQCLEMSPAITCNKRCRHCWRDTSVYSTGWVGPVDEPKEIVEGCIKERMKLLSGFKGNLKVDRTKALASFLPRHAAISLTGEPMMYPRFSELVKEFYSHDFETVFVVTSGTVPSTINALLSSGILPTNLYISVEAWEPEMYKKLCIPVIPNAWELFLESASLLKYVPARTIMRITCMKGLNMHSPESFAWLVKAGNPDIVECKAYAWMGYSRQRMSPENVPNHAEVLAFAKALGLATGYELLMSKAGSDVALLRRPSYRNVNGEEFIYDGLEAERRFQIARLAKIRKVVERCNCMPQILNELFQNKIY
ncbi:MAG: 4-demethylwyosine synthase TYW1 [Candidatus Woesearchaeota archaeon]